MKGHACISLLVFSFLIVGGIFAQEKDKMKYNKLTEAEKAVIIDKGTERPFSGIYYKFDEDGNYLCKQCGQPLFHSSDKFNSECGWPSFDDAIPGAVKQIPDRNGIRTEIVCSNCGAHLGHVFTGEKFTPKDTRYCVNSISLNFLPLTGIKKEEKKAIFASGCFWGTEYMFRGRKGVLATRVGYSGGHVKNPTYQQVSRGNTGHAESLEITYDPKKISYEELVKLFFETHDFTQIGGQGPDIGPQYRSAIFYLDDEQKKTAEEVKKLLRDMGYSVATEITKAGVFWPAEDYHQNYYGKTGGQPYCHAYRKIF